MKRYVYSARLNSKQLEMSRNIPGECRKYYKVDTNMDSDELDELTEEYGDFGLKLVTPLIAKSRYFDILSMYEIDSVSLCTDSKGRYGVYVFRQYGVEDITYAVEDIIDRYRRDR